MITLRHDDISSRIMKYNIGLSAGPAGSDRAIGPLAVRVSKFKQIDMPE